MKANVQFKEKTTNTYLTYEPEITFSSVRGMKVSLSNAIQRNIPTLQRFFGYCKIYEVFVIMNGKQVAKTTLAC